MIYYVSL